MRGHSNTDVLVPLDSTANGSNTPTSTSVVIRLERPGRAESDALAGKVLVDISNPFNATFDGLEHGAQTSNAQKAAAAAPANARVVKGFNTIFAHMLDQGRPDVVIAGDDAQAKAGVEAFITSMGLRPRDIGTRLSHGLHPAGSAPCPGPARPWGARMLVWRHPRL